MERFADEFAPEANRVALPKKSDVVVRDIKQVAIACNAEQRYDCLLKFYGLLATGSSVIFVRVSDVSLVTVWSSPVQRRVQFSAN